MGDNNSLEPKKLKGNSSLVEVIKVNSYLYYSKKPELLKNEVHADYIYAVNEMNDDGTLVIVSVNGEPRRIIRQNLLEDNYWYGLTIDEDFLKRYGII